VFVNLKGSKDN